MSNWIVPKIEDIEVKENELHIYTGSDDYGNNYVSVEGEALKHLIEITKDIQVEGKSPKEKTV